MNKLKIAFSIGVVLALLVAVIPAQAAEPTLEDGGQWLSFVGIPCDSDYNPDDAGVGEAQFRVYVQSSEDGFVDFWFYNTGPVPSTIEAVYFDDGALLRRNTIINDEGNVEFSWLEQPQDLPGGNCIDFETTQDFKADADAPPAVLGVDPGEWLGISFELVVGAGLDNVIAQLISGELRIGIHAISIGDDERSESFVNNGFTAVELTSFEASSIRGETKLSWTTGAEINNAGFNIYRSSTGDGSKAKLNGALIAAKGNDVSSAAYSFSDTPGYGSFYYWLEDVELTGARTLHGPVLVDIKPAISRPLYRPTLPGAY